LLLLLIQRSLNRLLTIRSGHAAGSAGAGDDSV